MNHQIVEITIADVPQEEAEERKKTFMRLLGKAFVNSAREAMANAKTGQAGSQGRSQDRI